MLRGDGVLMPVEAVLEEPKLKKETLGGVMEEGGPQLLAGAAAH